MDNDALVALFRKKLSEYQPKLRVKYSEQDLQAINEAHDRSKNPWIRLELESPGD